MHGVVPSRAPIRPARGRAGPARGRAGSALCPGLTPRRAERSAPRPASLDDRTGRSIRAGRRDGRNTAQEVEPARPGPCSGRMTRTFLALAATLSALAVTTARAEQVGEVGVDWVGNDIVIDAIPDPKVEGVTCHIAYFERSLIDRLSQGNWFEDPSNASIACRQTGPIRLGDIDTSDSGEQVFRESRSIVLKSLRIKRIFDETNQTLIYLAHAQELTEGSAKMAISTVPLYGAAMAGD
ncbi:CreA protein [Jannaschia seosinensis]|uniref:CreA protein n=2 Tax=Jannaschia seosinensis TaxID=313367 RepID=A0A0M7B478_9RHOB|nr:CreA protein [Jannaschia seosinensis]